MASVLDIGCTHYRRKCDIVAPCCNKVYTCRFCHDSKESHNLNRKLITEVVCKSCETRQYIQEECKVCGTRFGNYVCLACRLFEDVDKGQFHCNQCGICRVGGSDNFTHCRKCDMCINASTIFQHKCLEDESHSDCSVCLEDFHSSREPLDILVCGHFIHKMCRQELIKSGRTTCPICSRQMH